MEEDSSSGASSPTRRRRSLFVGVGIDGTEFSIDQEDLHVLTQAMCGMGIPDDETWNKIWARTSIREDDAERRVRAFDGFRCLVASLGRHYPRQQVRVQLPGNLGNLSCLETLNLARVGIASLPSSIGKLKHLKHLNLANCRHLTKLPDEIGELTNLKRLDAMNSSIVSIPNSIGRLKNLEHLGLSLTNLTELPDEIGDLVNLHDLHLRSCKALRCLPESIGNLVNLRYLYLFGSGIVSLPDSLRNLTNLLRLGISSTPLLEGRDEHRTAILLQIIRQNPSLGCLELGEVAGTEVGYAMACNRARYRTGFGNRRRSASTREDSIIRSTLWPLLLGQALGAFRYYEDPWAFGYRPKFPATSIVSKSDAIYQLLLDGRESFLEVLIDRRPNR